MSRGPLLCRPRALRAGRHLFSLWGQAPCVLFLGVSPSTSRLVPHSQVGKFSSFWEPARPAVSCLLPNPGGRRPGLVHHGPTVLLTRPRPGLISALLNSLLDSHWFPSLLRSHGIRSLDLPEGGQLPTMSYLASSLGAHLSPPVHPQDPAQGDPRGLERTRVSGSQHGLWQSLQK